jgi:dTDP-4-dehydrorhamnose 3,5-epimerase-like enzyme|tara:strand:- start:491 stop:640 length:150 start_codon:yes stop_codon:yes gene_type:complete
MERLLVDPATNLTKGCDVQIEKTLLPGVLILTLKRFGDGHVAFSESWQL